MREREQQGGRERYQYRMVVLPKGTLCNNGCHMRGNIGRKERDREREQQGGRERGINTEWLRSPMVHCVIMGVI